MTLNTHQMVTRSKMSTFKSKAFSIVSSPSVISESRSYKQALKILEWKKAMKNKIDALNAKNT